MNTNNYHCRFVVIDVISCFHWCWLDKTLQKWTLKFEHHKKFVWFNSTSYIFLQGGLSNTRIAKEEKVSDNQVWFFFFRNICNACCEGVWVLISSRHARNSFKMKESRSGREANIWLLILLMGKYTLNPFLSFSWKWDYCLCTIYVIYTSCPRKKSTQMWRLISFKFSEIVRPHHQ